MEDLFSDAVRQLLLNRCTPDVVRAIEAGGSYRSLWGQIEEAGYADALVPETAGGAGMGLGDLYAVLALCGEFALPIPLGETLLARGVLSFAGVTPPRGTMSFGIGRLTPDRLYCGPVQGAKVSEWVLVNCSGDHRVLPVASAESHTSGFCLNADLEWPLDGWKAAGSVPVGCDLEAAQAALYAAQLAGALTAVFSRTLQYANDRQQFGKPIGKFQAIQHQLSVMSEHVFAARMAAQLGLRSMQLQPDRIRAAIAKARTSEAALEVASLSHSIHGAIGFTAEFDLQLYTRRLHAWRQAAGSESFWHDVVGAEILGASVGPALDLIRTATDMI